MEVVATKFMHGHWFMLHRPLDGYTDYIVSHTLTGYISTRKGYEFVSVESSFAEVSNNIEFFNSQGKDNFDAHMEQIKKKLFSNSLLDNHSLIALGEFDNLTGDKKPTSIEKSVEVGVMDLMLFGLWK